MVELSKIRTQCVPERRGHYQRHLEPVDSVKKSFASHLNSPFSFAQFDRSPNSFNKTCPNSAPSFVVLMKRNKTERKEKNDNGKH